MPAPGDQHMNNNVQNPFEEVKPRISEYTAQEIATIQSRLERQLGPEYISTRPGPSGQKVHYITGEKCIQLANEVFGFNGWSSSISNIQVDTVEENPTTRNINLGLSVIVRVTLRDGTYHEDIGYGDVANCKGKAAAFNKAKKEATTDALKRALRNFGNLLGNCMYDKDYLSKVMKVKAAPSKWDVGDLYRHSDYAPPAPSKKDVQVPAENNVNKIDQADPTRGDSLEDEFGDFDEDDFGLGHDPDFHPDGVLLPESLSSNFDAPLPAITLVTGEHIKSEGQSRPTPPLLSNQFQNLQIPSGPASSVQSTEISSSKNEQKTQQSKPQIHSNNTPLGRSNSGASNGGHVHAQTDANSATRAPQTINPVTGRVLNQPSRIVAASTTHSPAQKPTLLSSSGEESTGNGEPVIQSGFFSARAAPLLPALPDTEGPPPVLPVNLPSFNPYAESPSIRRTPGIDHSATKPLSRDLKQVPGGISGGTAINPTPSKTNIINPQLDATRKIGAPGSPSPVANRGLYKLPTMKRPLQQPNLIRPPLGDIPANGITSGPDGASDNKRPRLNGS